MSTLARQVAKTAHYQTKAREYRRAPRLYGARPMLNCRRAPRSNSLHLDSKEKRHARFPNSFSSQDESAIADPYCNPTACFRQFFWLFFIDCLILGWVGANSPDAVFHGVPFLWIGQAATAYYFAHLLIIIPLIGILEKPKTLPESINAAITADGAAIKTAE